MITDEKFFFAKWKPSNSRVITIEMATLCFTNVTVYSIPLNLNTYANMSSEADQIQLHHATGTYSIGM